MDIPAADMGPGHRHPIPSNQFCRGGAWIVLRCAYKVIKWVIRAVFRYVLYLSYIVVLLGLVALYFFWTNSRVNELEWVPVICLNSNNQALNSSSEISKADAAASTTLMTLLPALLTFGPFRTARISSLIVFSTSAALLTAGFSLGLATSNVMTLPKHKIFKVGHLCTEITIQRYGAIQDPGGELDQLYLPGQALGTLPLPVGIATSLSTSSSPITEIPPSTTGVSSQTPVDNALWDIMERAKAEDKRPTKIYLTVMTFGFFLIQFGLFLTLVFYIPSAIEIDILWLCSGVGNYFVGWWIGITAILAGIIRTYAESSGFSKVEILHLRPLSPSFIFSPCQNCITSNQQRKQPTGEWFGITPKISQYMPNLPAILRRLWIAQKSAHSMILVLRPSEVVDNDDFDLMEHYHVVLRGFFQAILLILLTVLFASMYNGQIMSATIFITCFITVLFISRTNSIHFCAWIEDVLDTIQIEYATPTELTAIRTILSGMPSMLIHNTTRKRKYAAGDCLTPKRSCTDHTWSFAKPLPPMIRMTAAALSGLTLFGIIMVVFIMVMLPARLYDGFSQWTGYAIFWVAVSFLIGFVVEKVYSDFEFLETLGDDGGAGSSGGMTSV